MGEDADLVGQRVIGQRGDRLIVVPVTGGFPALREPLEKFTQHGAAGRAWFGTRGVPGRSSSTQVLDEPLDLGAERDLADTAPDHPATLTLARRAPRVQAAGTRGGAMHNPDTHAHLLARIPAVTGQDLRHWLSCLDAGPGLLRPQERADWLASSYGLPAAYAGAIVHEHGLRRAALRR